MHKSIFDIKHSRSLNNNKDLPGKDELNNPLLIYIKLCRMNESKLIGINMNEKGIEDLYTGNHTKNHKSDPVSVLYFIFKCNISPNIC
jgi:hypothetical protein